MCADVTNGLWLGTRGGGTGRLIFKDVKVPAENLIGGLNEGALIFDTMMVPERLTSAGGSLGMARAALEGTLSVLRSNPR